MQGRYIPDPVQAAGYESSDQLFNVCCYAFLCNVADAVSPELYKSLRAKDASILAYVVDKTELEYDGTYAYGDLYRRLIMSLENELGNRHARREAELKMLGQGEDLDGTQMSDMLNTEDSAEDLRACHLVADELDEVVKAVMVNDNLSLERAAEMIKIVNFSEGYDDYDSFKKTIKDRMRDEDKTINSVTPVSREKGRMGEALGSQFHEMGFTGIPCIKHYDYLKLAQLKAWPVELRVGTQFVRTSQLEGHVSYIYQRWLQVKDREYENSLDSENSGQMPITHIYFHNMAKDKDVDRGVMGGVNPAVHQEYLGTELLMQLEEHYPNMLLIVLPADSGYMSHDMASSHEPKYVVRDAKAGIYQILMGQKPQGDTDFHMSTYASDRVFGPDKEVKSLMMRTLIEQGFHRMGIYDDLDVISDAQFQAVYFDIVKYQLTNYVLKVLQPEFVSYPCKNNIDRGGITSAYCNLMKSIDEGNPLSEAEFKQAVQASPVLVKGRALNHHIINLWNVVKHYLIGCEKNGVDLPKELLYLQSWVHGHKEFGKDEDFVMYAKAKQTKLADYMVMRLDRYKQNLEQGWSMASGRLFASSEHKAKYKAMQKMKRATVDKLVDLLSGNNVEFTKEEMDYLRDPVALEASEKGPDNIQAVYRDIMSVKLINMSHLPADADIEMDDMSDKKNDAPGGHRGPRGGGTDNSNF